MIMYSALSQQHYRYSIIRSFIHSFIQAISIAPLQVHYYC